MIITINEKNGKTLNDAIELLRNNGFDVNSDYSLKVFCKEEANFRLNEEIDLYESNQEIYNNLNDEEKIEIENLLAEEYFDREIFDYDYLTDITNEVFEQYMKSKAKTKGEE